MRLHVTWTTYLRLAAFAFASLQTYSVCGNGQPKPLNLMPMPASVKAGDGVLRLDGTFDVTIHGPKDERLQAAVHRFVGRLANQTGLPLVNIPTAQGVLVVECLAASPAVPQFGED